MLLPLTCPEHSYSCPLASEGKSLQTACTLQEEQEEEEEFIPASPKYDERSFFYTTPAAFRPAALAGKPQTQWATQATFLSPAPAPASTPAPAPASTPAPALKPTSAHAPPTVSGSAGSEQQQPEQQHSGGGSQGGSQPVQAAGKKQQQPQAGPGQLEVQGQQQQQQQQTEGSSPKKRPRPGAVHCPSFAPSSENGSTFGGLAGILRAIWLQAMC